MSISPYEFRGSVGSAALRGDIEKTLGKNGSSILFSGGVAQRTLGPMNAVKYSLFASDWVGNMFVTGDMKLQSDFQELHSKTMTLDALLNIADSAKRSLNWMIRRGSYKKIDAAARVIDGGVIITQIWFTDNTNVIKKLEVRKYAQYWEIEGEL